MSVVIGLTVLAGVVVWVCFADGGDNVGHDD